MRLIFLVILVLCVNLASAQYDSLDWRAFEGPDRLFKSCDDARGVAVLDSQSGFLAVEGYHRIGFVQNDFVPESFYTNYLFHKYKIKRFMRACRRSDYEECYFDEMKKIITEKYSWPSFQTLDILVKQEYEKFKLLDAEVVKRYIDFNYVYEEVDMITCDPAGQKHFTKQLKSKIDLKKLRLHGYKLKDVYLEVVVDEAGDIVDCKIISMNFPSEVNVEIENAVKKIGGWKPAELYGLKVKSRIVIYF